MKTEELEQEAAKYGIGEYFDGHRILRSQIIRQLIERDIYLQERRSFKLSIASLIVAAIAVITSVLSIFTQK